MFTHREIAQRLMDTFTGLKVKELAWFENPREKTLKKRKAPCAPGQVAAGAGGGSGVPLPPTAILTPEIPLPPETDFFTVTRLDAWGVSTWFMCTPEAAENLIAMDYDNLAVKETTIVG